MKIIIDCNVLIAAELKDGICRAVLRYTIQHCNIYLSEEILLEYLSVIRRDKFRKHYSVLETLATLLCDVAAFVKGTSTFYTLPDPKDLIYLQAAESAQVQYIITGNTKDFPDHICQNVKIITPTLFYELFL